MQASAKIDFSRLLGFDLVSEELVDSIDFLNETVGARIGVKRGDKEMSALDLTSQPSRSEN